MKIWLDDVREMPKDFDVWVKSSEDAIYLLKTENVTHMSLDYDLGGNDVGVRVLEYVEKLELNSKGLLPVTFAIHSANPAGVRHMNLVLDSIMRIRKEKIKKHG